MQVNKKILVLLTGISKEITLHESDEKTYHKAEFPA
jgi:hypothetical protein